MIKDETETQPKTDTFVAVEGQEEDTVQSEGTVPEDDSFEIINPGLSSNQSHEKLPFSDMDICFKTPSEEWKTFQVHKVILVNSSGYIADRIKEDENSDRTKISIMERCIEESDMKSVLDLIYCGRSGSLKKEKENQILDLLRFFKVESYKIVQVAEPQNFDAPLVLPSSINALVSEEKKKRPTSPGRLQTWGGTPKKVKLQNQKVKVEKPKTKVQKPKVEKTKIKVEKNDHLTPFTEEELTWTMQHNIIPTENGAGFCVPCGKIFSQRSNAFRHFKNTHGYQGSDTTFCQGCGVKLTTSHMKEHFKTQPCGSKFNNKLLGSQEDASGEMDKFIISPEAGKGICLICEKSFSQLSNAKRHYKSAHSIKSESYCVMCGKALSDIANHYKNNHNVGQTDINKWITKLLE